MVVIVVVVVVVVVVVDEEKSWHLLGWVAMVGFDVSEGLNLVHPEGSDKQNSKYAFLTLLAYPYTK